MKYCVLSWRNRTHDILIPQQKVYVESSRGCGILKDTQSHFPMRIILNNLSFIYT